MSLEIVDFKNKLPTRYGTLPNGSMLTSRATVSVFSSVAWEKALGNGVQVIPIRGWGKVRRRVESLATAGAGFTYDP